MTASTIGDTPIRANRYTTSQDVTSVRLDTASPARLATPVTRRGTQDTPPVVWKAPRAILWPVHVPARAPAPAALSATAQTRPLLAQPPL